MAQPKLRIKGFEGEWKTNLLGNVSSSYSGGTPIVGERSYYGGNIPFIRSGEIHNDKTELYITELGLSSSSAKMVEKGTLLYALYGATSGEVDISKIKGAINQAILAIIPDENICKYFLNYLLQTKKNHIVGSLIQGGQGNLSGALLKNYNIVYPENKKEQEKLANYLKSLDSLIQATTKKIESLKQLKSASLVSMFPQSNEKAPRVRFKGFEGEWTECSFGKIGKTYSGLTGKCKEDFGIGDARYITFLNVLTNAQINTTLLEHVNVQKGEHQNEVRKGDMFFNTSSETPEEVGMCAVVNEELSNVYLNSFCFGFRLSNENINPLYIAYLMRSPIGRKIMMILAQGATRYNLSKSCLYKAIVPIPETKTEQDKIANYLSSLDSQISIQEHRLEKLKQIKAACLEKMFV